MSGHRQTMSEQMQVYYGPGEVLIRATDANASFSQVYWPHIAGHKGAT